MEYRSLFVDIHAAWVGVRKGWADVARLGRLMDGACILRVKPLFLLWESGVFCLPVGFLPARLGPKPLFLLQAKEKAVLDSEKEKGDQWK